MKAFKYILCFSVGVALGCLLMLVCQNRCSDAEIEKESVLNIFTKSPKLHFSREQRLNALKTIRSWIEQDETLATVALAAFQDDDPEVRKKALGVLIEGIDRNARGPLRIIANTLDQESDAELKNEKTRLLSQVLNVSAADPSRKDFQQHLEAWLPTKAE
jgi:hypothetical protein